MKPVSKRIMIVEDQRLIAADLEATLRKLGYDIAANVAAGEDAVIQATATRPDLILMDIRLRGDMDGVEAAEAIRQRRDIPVVFLTAYADDETISRAKSTTPFGYVVKPFNERELRAAIEIAIYKHETDRLLSDERARRRAAEEFKLLVDGVKDYAIMMLDASGHVATWNEGARRIKGYRADEILGKHFSVFHVPEEAERGVPDEILASALQDGRSQLEGWRVRRDGSRFWAHCVMTPIRDAEGRLHGFGRVTRDLTERKRQEERRSLLDRATITLAASLDLSMTLQPAARLVVPDMADWCLIDLVQDDGRLLQVAAAHVDPDCQALAERLGRDLALAPSVPNGALHAFITGTAVLLPDAQPTGAEQPELFRRLGVSSSILVPIQFRGRKFGVLSLLRGDSAPRYEAADLGFAEDLAQRIALAVDNARLYEDAQEAILARDEFLQIASHELKTPLTPLQLQLDSLASSLEKTGVSNDRLAHRLAAATRQTERLTRLVESLLDVSRITSGRLALDPEPVDVAALLNDIGTRFSAEAERAGSRLTVQVDGQPKRRIVGHWDRLRIEQILSNLLSNAIKYGGGGPIEIVATPHEEVVRISVRDHGIGIQDDALQRIFGRFERAVSMRHYGGLGLGLFIARQLAEAHGGTIIAQSKPGDGSTFTVVLPLRTPVGYTSALDTEVQ